MPKKSRKEILDRMKKIDNVIITEDVLKFILEQESAAAEKVIRSMVMLSEFGLKLPKTYYHRIWESSYKLWELITSYAKNEYRSLFFSINDGKFLIAHAIVKRSNKLPTKDVNIADKIFVEWLNEGGKKND